jgi:plastocyanin
VFAVPTEPVSVDQKGCIFLPRVVGVQVDQPLKFLNSDALAHNVHGFAQTAKPWNVSLGVKGMTRTIKADKPETVIEVKCDVHPWMRAYVGVFSHPYFAVSGTDGSFTFRNLPRASIPSKPGTNASELGLRKSLWGKRKRKKSR